MAPKASVAGLVTSALLAAAGVPYARASCPYGGDLSNSLNSAHVGVTTARALKSEIPRPHGHPSRALQQKKKVVLVREGTEVNPLFSGDNVLPPLTAEQLMMVKTRLNELLTDSKDFFPADFGGSNGGSYVGLFIRLAWHCSGSYRTSDGRGGCDGARIRFPPEFLWPDNTNLDKALELLQPAFDEFSDIISKGDLIALMGNVAIESGGGPTLGFCGGRVDDADGTDSLALGPSPIQEGLQSCPPDQGPDCEEPLGPAIVGLIYVEANGPTEAPSNTTASAAQIRTIFSRMNFVTDREQVALIGGGHEMGKVHGACPDGPGEGPTTCPSAPYVGSCNVAELEDGVTGIGTGLNTFTSGFEGPWTENPTTWSNEYFQNLLEYRWELVEAPGGGGRMQWAPFDFETGEPGPEITMLTTDIAFIDDPDYRAIVEEFAADSDAFDDAFASAWYKLTTQDMGPVSRCIGTEVPPAQPFQDPLPEATVPTDTDLTPVRDALVNLVETDESRGLLADLAFSCASTFRSTHWVGGCNGARIRFPPQVEFPGNERATDAIALLTPMAEEYADIITFADLIVYAGNIALAAGNGPEVPLCRGRVDAEDGTTSVDLSPRDYYNDPVIEIRDTIDILGVSAAEFVALAARPTADKPDLTNDLFVTLTENTWVPVLEEGALKVDPMVGEYMSVETQETIPVQQWALLRDPMTLFYVQEFARNPEALTATFAQAWEYLMNADRFDGPRGNVCTVEA